MENLVNADEELVGGIIKRVKLKNIPIILLDINPEIVAKVSNYYIRLLL
ncbi:hypothetical protein [Clostridium beijerinckii]|nr:hypothetical protein [Clostridium beijerinckii]NOW06709.1 ABC-type sugar transport system substrate-binding protein [Clostridium beijerinckii]NYC00146.1 ABC-type sugar transport system substrate-binding protein [Clostridium beijerinckii]